MEGNLLREEADQVLDLVGLLSELLLLFAHVGVLGGKELI